MRLDSSDAFGTVIGYAPGEAPLGYAEASADVVAEHDEPVLQSQ